MIFHVSETCGLYTLFIHFNTVYSPGYAVWPYWWQCLHPWLSVSILRPPSICCCSCQCNSASQVKPHLTSLLKKVHHCIDSIRKAISMNQKQKNDVFTFQVFILLKCICGSKCMFVLYVLSVDETSLLFMSYNCCCIVHNYEISVLLILFSCLNLLFIILNLFIYVLHISYI